MIGLRYSMMRLLPILLLFLCACHAPQPRTVVMGQAKDLPISRIIAMGDSMRPVLKYGDICWIVEDFDAVQVGNIISAVHEDDMGRPVRIVHIVVGGDPNSGWITDCYRRNNGNLTRNWRRVWRENYIGTVVAIRPN